MSHSVTDFESARYAVGASAPDTTDGNTTGDDATDGDTTDGNTTGDDAADGDAPRANDHRDAAVAAEAPNGNGRDSDGSDGRSGVEARRSRRVVVGYALLFSLPVGVGVAVMLLQVTGGRPTDTVVAGPSLALAVAVFLLLLGVGAGGSPEP